MKYLKYLFPAPPTADQLAKHLLAQARIDLLLSQAELETAQSRTNSYLVRVRRLEAYQPIDQSTVRSFVRP